MPVLSILDSDEEQSTTVTAIKPVSKAEFLDALNSFHQGQESSEDIVVLSHAVSRGVEGMTEQGVETRLRENHK